MKVKMEVTGDYTVFVMTRTVEVDVPMTCLPDPWTVTADEWQQALTEAAVELALEAVGGDLGNALRAAGWAVTFGDAAAAADVVEWTAERLDESTVPTPAILLADGARRGKGDVAFSYYDMEWVGIASDPDHEGWVRTVTHDGRRGTYNGERLTAVEWVCMCPFRTGGVGMQSFGSEQHARKWAEWGHFCVSADQHVISMRTCTGRCDTNEPWQERLVHDRDCPVHGAV